MSKQPAISVCMPMYNAAPHLHDCIESVLQQTWTDLEFIIVDDGSTDESLNIARSFADCRVRVITHHHDYIASLNLAMREARGKYIARMDADDLMHPQRLALQWEYMEQHPEIDILGGKIAVFRDNPSTVLYEACGKIGRLSLADFVEHCALCHPTVMMRRESMLDMLDELYRPCMVYAEDYDLWVRSLIKGKVIHNINSTLLHYRQHETQVSTVHSEQQQTRSQSIRQQALQAMQQEVEQSCAAGQQFPPSSCSLTVVIPFLNEGEEVKNTLNSIYSTINSKVEIIVINDASDDGYDYEHELSEFPIHYVENPSRIGAAQSKEKGVRMANTPYFILLDAHMRFYQKGWEQHLLDILSHNSERLLCCKSIFLQKNQEGMVEEIAGSRDTFGAYLQWKHDSLMPSIDWNYHASALPSDELPPIPCVLGAGYATSRAYWQRLHGLEGLIHYGCEEAYISIKAWREGGGCFLLPRLGIGHIYRQAFPYTIYNFQNVYNYLWISETLFPLSLRMQARYVAWQQNKKAYQAAMHYLDMHQKQREALREVYNKFKGGTFYEVWQRNERCRHMAIHPALPNTASLDAMISWLREQSRSITSAGLYAGTTGLLLTALYHVEIGHEESEEWAVALWESLATTLQQPRVNNFRCGNAGIGWALIYAATHGLLEDNVEEELRWIDQQVETQSIARTKDLSFWEGVGGIYAYVVTRCLYARSYTTSTTSGVVESPLFSTSFIEELTSEAPHILDASEDWRTKCFVAQFMSLPHSTDELLPPQLSDITELPNYVPQHKKVWQCNLSSVLGTVLHTLHHNHCLQSPQSPSVS